MPDDPVAPEADVRSDADRDAQKGASSAADEVIVVGQFASPFGVKGWIKVKSFTDPGSNLVGYRPWLVTRADNSAVPPSVDRRHWQRVALQQVKPHQNGFVAKIAEVDDRDAALVWRGREIAVASSALPPVDDDEYYWRDLVSCGVWNLAGEHLGEVREVLPTGANDVLVLTTEGDDRLVPFAESILQSVSISQKKIVVDWDLDF